MAISAVASGIPREVPVKIGCVIPKNLSIFIDDIENFFNKNIFFTQNFFRFVEFNHFWPRIKISIRVEVLQS